MNPLPLILGSHAEWTAHLQEFKRKVSAASVPVKSLERSLRQIQPKPKLPNSFRLLDLPYDIRLIIVNVWFEEVSSFHPYHGFRVQAPEDPHEWKLATTPPGTSVNPVQADFSSQFELHDLLALLQTGGQLRVEALSRIYSTTIFQLDKSLVRKHRSGLQLPKGIGRSWCFSCIRSLELSLSSAFRPTPRCLFKIMPSCKKLNLVWSELTVDFTIDRRSRLSIRRELRHIATVKAWLESDHSYIPLQHLPLYVRLSLMQDWYERITEDNLLDIKATRRTLLDNQINKDVGVFDILHGSVKDFRTLNQAGKYITEFTLTVPYMMTWSEWSKFVQIPHVSEWGGAHLYIHVDVKYDFLNETLTITKGKQSAIFPLFGNFDPELGSLVPIKEEPYDI